MRKINERKISLTNDRLLDNRLIDEALRQFEQMEQSGCRPNARTFCLVFTACGEQQVMSNFHNCHSPPNPSFSCKPP